MDYFYELSSAATYISNDEHCNTYQWLPSISAMFCAYSQLMPAFSANTYHDGRASVSLLYIWINFCWKPGKTIKFCDYN
jgi:hypothetical protein